MELHYRTTPPANWSWTGFSEEYPSSGFTGGSKDVKVASESALENHTALKLHIRQKGTSKDWHMRWKILYNCRLIPVKDQLFPWDQWLAFVKSVLNICSRILWITASGWACNSRQQWALKFQPFTSVLDPIRGQCCFLSDTYLWKIQEVTDQRRYCGAWIEITFCLRYNSPRTERTCHSVGTTCSREVCTNSSGCTRSPKFWKIHLGCPPRMRVHWQWYFLWRYCTFFNHQIFPDSGPRKRKCVSARIWQSAMAKHTRYCCHMTSFWCERCFGGHGATFLIACDRPAGCYVRRCRGRRSWTRWVPGCGDRCGRIAGKQQGRLHGWTVMMGLLCSRNTWATMWCSWCSQHVTAWKHSLVVFILCKFGRCIKWRQLGTSQLSCDFFPSLTRSLVVLVVRSIQPSSFLGRLELQPSVLVDQVWYSNRKCPITAPWHLFVPHKKAITLVLLNAHANLEVLPDAVSNDLRSLLAFKLKSQGIIIDNHHGSIDSNDLHLQPFSRFSSLQNFARIFFCS